MSPAPVGMSSSQSSRPCVLCPQQYRSSGPFYHPQFIVGTPELVLKIEEPTGGKTCWHHTMSNGRAANGVHPAGRYQPTYNQHEGTLLLPRNLPPPRARRHRPLTSPHHTIPPKNVAHQAAARRFAKQEQEAQAREDELLALRLAAREEASAERRAARRRDNVSRRNARRSTIPAGHLGFDNPPVAAAALAALVGGGAGAGGAAGGGGGTVGVSDAVRALQFQDIEANDYETLLALDEGGGEGGRCCAGGRGLTEEAVEAVLRPEEAAGGRLEESCAICMTDFEMDDEVRASAWVYVSCDVSLFCVFDPSVAAVVFESKSANRGRNSLES